MILSEIPILELLPQRPPFVMVDHLTDYSETQSSCDLTVRPDNVFFEDGKVSGFIDLGDAGIADRWYDIALGYRSLKHNVDGHYGKVYEGIDPDELFTKLGLIPDWEKIRYYILLDELF